MKLGPLATALLASVFATASCGLLDADGGATTGSGGAGGGASGTGAGGGAVACESESVDCSACRQCAAAGPCATALDACLDDASCSAIDECVAFCGSGADCQDMCRQQNPAGVATYDAARECLDCTTCPTKCEGATSCG